MKAIALRIILVVAALVMIAGDQAFAGSATSNITVTATVVKNCTITAGNVNFGSYDPTSATPLNATGTFTITCGQGTAYTVGLGAGANAQGTTRRMAGGSQFLTYELYQNTARSVVWNNTGTGMVSGTATSNSPITLTIYGQVTPSQNISIGSYTDTVVATVNF
jgi:spore coat protein U-like protein